MAGYQYLDYQYLDNITNPGANVTVLHEGDYLVSPSGVYNAVMNSNGGFVVSYGSVPNTQPSLWSVSAQSSYTGPWSVQTVPQWSQSEYYIWGNYKGSPLESSPIVAQDDYSTKPDFMQLNDNGTVSIYQGNNSIKTSPNENAIATSGKSSNVIAITMNTITYDTANTVYEALNKVVGLDGYYTISTSVDLQPYTFSVSLVYTNTQTFSWNTSATLSATISSATKISVPGIGDQTDTISLQGSIQISKGQQETQSEAVTQTGGGTVNVPAFSEYSVHATAYEQVANVPYTWTGIAYYADGLSAPITGTGTVLSDSTGVFDTEIDCVYQPGGCPTGPVPSPVPEPPTFITLPLAFAAILVVAAVRKRRRRGPRGQNFGGFAPA